MAKNIEDLTELDVPAGEDLFAIVNDPSGSAETQKITYDNFLLAGSGVVPSAKLFRSTNYTAIFETDSAMVFDTEVFDTDNMVDLTSGTTTRFTINTPGIYNIGGGIDWPANNAGWRIIYIKVNGVSVCSFHNDANVSAYTTGLCINTIYELAVDDYVELWQYQDGGNPSLTIASASPYNPIFYIIKVA